MNDFETICKNLEERKECRNKCCHVENEYICAKRAVEEYVKEDRNKMYKLYAESRKSDYWSYISIIFCSFSCVLAALSVCVSCYSIVEEVNSYWYPLIILSFILFACLVIMHIMNKFTCVRIWGAYVCVALEQVMQEKGK